METFLIMETTRCISLSHESTIDTWILTFATVESHIFCH